MADFLISDREMEALYGASGAAVKLYLALRSRMDYASCKAGLKTRLSWNVLGEAAETHVTRGSGQQIERPTLRQMRTAAEDLERRGLVRRVGNDELLVFLLPFAVVKQARPNQTRQSDVRVASGVTGQDTRQGSDTPDIQQAQRISASLRSLTGQLTGQSGVRVVEAEPGTHQTSNINVYTPSSSYTALSGVDASGDHLDECGLSAEGKGLDAVASRAADIAVMLRKQGARLTSADPRVLQWARDGVSDSVLLDAMTLAIDSRQREGSAQPIGSKYLDTIARDLFERASGARPVARWWATDEGTAEEGRRLGLEARIGESMQDFRARIKSAQQQRVSA